jgi:hypothetical protein
MFKNVASQKVTLLVIDTATNLPKTGDAANLTFYVSKDDGSVTALGDSSATEIDSTNALGLYTCDLTQAETNGDKLLFTGKSSTSGVRVVPLLLQTVPASFTSLVIANGCVDADVERFAGTAGTFSSGRPEVNTTHVGGTSQTARDIGASVLLSTGTGTGQLDFTSGVVKANLAQILGTALTETAGLLAGGFKKFFNVATPTGTLNSIPDVVPGNAGALLTQGTGTAQINPSGGKVPATTAAGDIATDAITGASVKADAVTKIQTGLATPTNITAGTITTVTNLTNAPTSGDLTATMKTSVTTAATAATPTVTAGTVSDKTGYGLADGAITAAKIATDAITAAKVASDAVTEIQSGLSTLTQANVRSAVGLASADLDTQLAALPTAAENAAALLTSTTNAIEPTSVPGWSASFGAKFAWLFALMRNKVTQTSSTKTLRNDADNASIATASVSDDGTTFTHAEWQ